MDIDGKYLKIEKIDGEGERLKKLWRQFFDQTG